MNPNDPLPMQTRALPSRRTFIKSTVAAAAALTVRPVMGAESHGKMGMTAFSAHYRLRSDSNPDLPRLSNAIEILEYARDVGAGCVQTGVHGWQEEFARKIRDLRESYGILLEGQISLPKDESDTGRFEKEIERAKEAGATILRTVCLSGRRYETFDSLESFQEFEKESWRRLRLAEPIARRQRVKIAIENHKDWRVPDMLKILEGLSSEHMGVCLDTGNSISLLEDPMEVVEALAPFSFTTHFKDMAVDGYEDGFLLSEVPLGEGYLDLKRIVETCRKHHPTVQFNLEMITRDPLEAPCLAERYWRTFPNLSGSDLAKILRMVRDHPPSHPLPRVSDKSPRERIAFEDLNIRKSFSHARSHLNLT